MSNPLLKVLLNDECNWPWEQKALEELNDVPELRAGKLETLQSKIREFAEKNPKFRPRMDEDFLMAFLRARKFNAQRAMDSFIKFSKIRLCNPERILPVGKGPRDYRQVYDKPLGVALPQRNPLDGTVIIIWSFRNFDRKQDNIEDVFNAFYYAATKIIIHPSFQTYGVRFIFDLTGITAAVVASFLTSMHYSKALLMAQGSFPARFRGLHAINNPFWGTHALYKLFQPFLSNKMKERIHLHGDDLRELHGFVSPSILPEIFGGTAGAFDASWMRTYIYDVHDEIVSESYFGWT